MAKTKTAAVTFSEAEVKSIESVLRGIWDDVGYDCLQATAEDTGKDVNTISIRRSQVVEIALDAGRPEERFRQIAATATRRAMKTVVTDDFIARYRAASYEQLIKIATGAFPCRSYGM